MFFPLPKRSYNRDHAGRPRVQDLSKRSAVLISTRRFGMKNPLIFFWAVVGLVVSTAAAASPVDTQLLEPLAKRFWAAEVQPDYEAVYDMLSPAEKNSITRDDYVKQRREVGPVRYLAAEVGEIEFAQELAWVHVKFEWMFPRYPSPGKPASTWHLWRYADGWHPIPLGQRDQWPEFPPRLRPAADEAALAKRTAGLWKAKAEQDWKGVYSYMPPEYRARIPLEKFLSSKARFLYINPQVEWVEVTGNEARASIAFLYRFNDPSVSKMPPIEQKVIEPWVKVDGDWYLNTSVLN
jgi:hypothetical protein